MKFYCPDCQTERDLTVEERLNINNDGFETHCHECGTEWNIQDVLRGDNPPKHFSFEGIEVFEKTAKPFGQNSAHVGVPKNWIGCRVAIVRLDEESNR